METNTKTTSLNGLSAKLNDLLVRQAAEQVRVEKIAPQKAGYIITDGITAAQKAEVVRINADPNKTQKQVNGLKALGWITKQKAGKIDDKELVTLKSINDDIKIVLGQIRDLTKSSVKTSSGSTVSDNPMTPERRTKNLRNWFNGLSAEGKKKYGITFDEKTGRVASSVIKNKTGKTVSSYYGIEIQRNMVDAKIAPTTEDAHKLLQAK
jgi:hypothetical protein